MFDEEPEDLHGECAAEIHRLKTELRDLETARADAEQRCREAVASQAERIAGLDKLLAREISDSRRSKVDRELLRRKVQHLEAENWRLRKFLDENLAVPWKEAIRLYELRLNPALELLRKHMEEATITAQPEDRAGHGEEGECPACDGLPCPPNNPCRVCGRQEADRRAAQLEDRAGHGGPALTPFPDIGCEGECAFNTAGIGLQCETCKAYLHPGDKHHAEVKAYYEQENPND